MEKSKTLDELTNDVKASFADYDRQGTQHWSWETAMKDLTYQIGSLTKVSLQLSGERFAEGKSKTELDWQFRNELADILAEVLYIASEKKINLEEAISEMIQDDQSKIADRTKN